MKMDRISLLLLIASAMTNALGSTVMKHAYGGDTSILSSGIIAGVFKILLNPWIIVGLGMFGVSFFFMAAALSRTDLTLAYPMMSGLVYIILIFVGFFIFKEKITVLRIMGIGTILLGITMLTMKS
jgi:multidrug transporter EmrE-like cation transporter